MKQIFQLLVDLDRALGENRRSGGFTLSLDGGLAVVQVSEEQSRWHELRVLDTRTGEWLPDALTGYLGPSPASGGLRTA